MIFLCAPDARRAAIRAAVASGAAVNGIDYVEVAIGAGELLRRTILVYFVSDLTGAVPTPDNWEISGGDRYRTIKVLEVVPTGDPKVLRLTTDQIGDLSWYTLRLTKLTDPSVTPTLEYDPALAEVSFTFRPGCGADLDCREATVTDVGPLEPVDVDYTAKDYAAFRRVLLDRMSLLQPAWTDAEPADIRMVILEAMAYTADRLSYMQDVITTESYIGTARQRISIRRHARLVDYAVSEGCCSRAFVRLLVSDVADGPPARTRLMSGSEAESPVVRPFSTQERDLRSAGALVFEVRESPRALFVAHNAMRFHTWSGSVCRLPAGTTSAALRGAFPDLEVGDLLVVTSTQPGETDPDPTSERRHPIRVSGIEVATDPVSGEAISHITWTDADALPFDLDITQAAGQDEFGAAVGSLDVAAALGNIVVVDHGETIRDEHGGIAQELITSLQPDDGDPSQPATETPDESDQRPGRPPVESPRLAYHPVSWRAPLPSYDPTPDAATGAPPAVGDRTSAHALRNWDRTDVCPDLQLSEGWEVVADLMAADEADADVVLEVDDSGTGRLRFGDGINGRKPSPREEIKASYAIGIGTTANVGPDAVNRLIADEPVVDLAGVLARVSNPMPAFGGLDPEPLEVIRQRAPYEHLKQLRCVTAEDYATRAQEHPGVQRAAARLRWTGSWQTVFLYVDRVGGKSVASDSFAAELASYLEVFRLMGHDIEVRDPVYVPLDLTLRVCPQRGAHWPTLRARLEQLFSARVLPDGTLGLFHPDRLTFGAPIDTGPLISAAQQVPGVAWTDIVDIHTVGTGTSIGIKDGRLILEAPQIPRLDNDPDFPDRGTFHAELAVMT